MCLQTLGKHQWAPWAAMVASEARCEDPVPQRGEGTLITVGAEGQHTGGPFKWVLKDAQEFPRGRWKSISWQRIQWNRFEMQEKGSRILFILLGRTRPSASCEWSCSARWLNRAAQREKEHRPCRHPVSSGQSRSERQSFPACVWITLCYCPIQEPLS